MLCLCRITISAINRQVAKSYARVEFNVTTGTVILLMREKLIATVGEVVQYLLT